MKNKYIKHAHISENKFRADLTSTQIAEVTKINRNTINRILQLLRARILKLTEEESYFEAGETVPESIHNKYESLLQHLGPSMLPMESSAFDVILLDSPQGLPVRGVAFEMIEMNIPVLMPAPQAPQNPHAPPGTLCPLFIISVRASDRSICPPALWYAVNKAAPTIT